MKWMPPRKSATADVEETVRRAEALLPDEFELQRADLLPHAADEIPVLLVADFRITELSFVIVLPVLAPWLEQVRIGGAQELVDQSHGDVPSHDIAPNCPAISPTPGRSCTPRT